MLCYGKRMPPARASATVSVTATASMLGPFVLHLRQSIAEYCIVRYTSVMGNACFEHPDLKPLAEQMLAASLPWPVFAPLQRRMVEERESIGDGEYSLCISSSTQQKRRLIIGDGVVAVGKSSSGIQTSRSCASYHCGAVSLERVHLLYIWEAGIDIQWQWSSARCRAIKQVSSRARRQSLVE